MFTRNDRTHFYKYLGPEGAFKTLEEGRMRWSSPNLFNDPYDMQFDLHPGMPPEEMVEVIRDNLLDAMFSGADVPCGLKGRVPPDEWKTLQASLKGKTRQELRKVLEEGGFKGYVNSEKLIEGSRELLELATENFFVYCLSVVKDSIPMWSHYAKEHTGAVIQFKCVPDLDNIFISANPVQYSKELPALGSRDEWKKRITECVELDVHKLLFDIVMTKSEAWASECEWRLSIPITESAGQPHAYLTFKPIEVEAIYLGCRISEADRKRISDVARADYPHAELYQAKKNSKAFSLDFEKIN